MQKQQSRLTVDERHNSRTRFEHLKRLTRLEDLNVDLAVVTAADADELRKPLPKTRISHYIQSVGEFLEALDTSVLRAGALRSIAGIRHGICYALSQSWYDGSLKPSVR